MQVFGDIVSRVLWLCSWTGALSVIVFPGFLFCFSMSTLCRLTVFVVERVNWAYGRLLHGIKS